MLHMAIPSILNLKTTRLPKRSVALRARVVSALLVHRAHVLPQIAGVSGLVVALRARVSAQGSFPWYPGTEATEQVYECGSQHSYPPTF